jgi:amino acid transporter
MPYGFKHIFAATNAVIFGFFGFESAASLFTIVENPQKNVPRALQYSIVLVGFLYLLFVASIIYAVPLSHFTSPSLSLRTILGTIIPNHPWLLWIIQFSVLSAILGTVHSMIWGSSTLLIAYVKKFKSPRIKKIIQKNIISVQTSVAFIGICSLFTY